MTPADLPAVVAIAARSLSEAWTSASFAAELDKPTCLACVVEAPSMVAFAIGSLVVDELEILTLAVASEVRRAGHGRRVLDALLGAAVARGARRAFLEVRAGNTAAIALYRARGFAVEGRRARYYGDGEDALLMASALVT